MTADTAVVLSVSHARRRYGERAALAGVSLEIAMGEVYALIGRNGAGKSTLAKAVIGALSLDSGTARVLGGDPARDPAARRAIGIAPQEIALYPHMTVAENLDAFATLAGLRTGRREAIAKAMEGDGLRRACARADRSTFRRMAAARQPRRRHRPQPAPAGPGRARPRASTPRPRVVLRRLIDRVRARGAAVLLISHDGEDVAALADRVGVLHAGRLAAEGSLQALMGKAFGERQELAVRLAAASTLGSPILDAHGLFTADQGVTWSRLGRGRPRPSAQNRSSVARRRRERPRAGGQAAGYRRLDRLGWRRRRPMILVMLRVMALSLWRDRAGLVLAFVLPPVVFIVFASVFGAGASGKLDVRAGVVNQAASAQGRRFVAALNHQLGGRLAAYADTSALQDAVADGRADAGLIIAGDLGLDPTPMTVLIHPGRRAAGEVLVAQVTRWRPRPCRM